jgi:hypothetical protein
MAAVAPNAALQLRRAISIQAEQRRPLEKHAIAPSAASFASELACSIAMSNWPNSWRDVNGMAKGQNRRSHKFGKLNQSSPACGSLESSRTRTKTADPVHIRGKLRGNNKTSGSQAARFFRIS